MIQRASFWLNFIHFAFFSLSNHYTTSTQSRCVCSWHLLSSMRPSLSLIWRALKWDGRRWIGRGGKEGESRLPVPPAAALDITSSPPRCAGSRAGRWKGEESLFYMERQSRLVLSPSVAISATFLWKSSSFTLKWIRRQRGSPFSM